MKIDHYLEIRDLIEQNIDDQLLNKLLESTMKFLSATDPSFQAKREVWLNDTHINKILQAVTTALNDFESQDQTDRNSKEVLQSCKNAIIDRLDSLAKTDKVSVYYHTEGNALELKSLLSPQSASKNDTHSNSTRNSF